MLILLFKNKNVWYLCFYDIYVIFELDIFFKNFHFISSLYVQKNTHIYSLDTQVHESLDLGLFFQIHKRLVLDLDLTKFSGSRSE